MKTQYFAVIAIAALLFPAFFFSDQNTNVVETRGGLRITKVDQNIIKIQNARNGFTIYKSVENTTLHKREGIPTLTIDMRTLDTAEYNWKYHYLTSFNAGMEDDDFELVAYDFNKDGKDEVVLRNRTYESPHRELGMGIYELGTGQDSTTMRKIYQYPDTLLIGGKTFGDIDQDGTMEFITSRNSSDADTGTVFSQLSSNALPTEKIGEIDSLYKHAGTNIPRLRNLDNDPNFELIYRVEKGSSDDLPQGIYNQICRFNSATHRFNVVFSHKLPIYTQGYAFGDFDLDGKLNFTNGSIDGRFFMYEYQGGNNWSFQLIDTLPTKNAYLTCTTNDLDGNGKPEIWIGGDTYINGIGRTLFTIYETTGDNTYEPVYYIDLIGIFSFYAGNIQVVDMDNDGKDEVFLCIDQHVLIFKYGNGGYYLWYVKENELAAAGQNSVVYSAYAANLDGKGCKEILMIQDIIDPIKGLLVFTSVYKSDIVTDVENKETNMPRQFQLFQNYPNPFNPATGIQYSVASSQKVILKVYDVLGREVTTLVNEKKSPGTYKVSFDGSNLSSGIYFYRLTAGDYTETKKMVLVR